MTVHCATATCAAQARDTAVALRRNWCRHSFADARRAVWWACPACVIASIERVRDAARLRHTYRRHRPS